MPTGYVAIAVAAPRDKIRLWHGKRIAGPGSSIRGREQESRVSRRERRSSSNPEAAFRLLECGDPSGELAPAAVDGQLPLRLAKRGATQQCPGLTAEDRPLRKPRSAPSFAPAFLTEQQRRR